jgi:prepilin-type N-terminal cleavage/methylation domain-containing protein
VKSGFTFVEVVIAMFVLVILVLGGGALVQRGQIDAITQKFKRVAIEAANGQMEKVVHELPYSTVDAWVGSPRATNVTLNGITGFNMITTVEDVSTNLIKITVNVKYEKKTNAGSVELVTYRSPGGI